jgi:hypothetical protein
MNNEFKGTKEKWNLTEPEGSNGFLYVGIYKGGEIATCYNVRGYEGYVTDETKANALLISKAPEMLEMLKEIIDNCCGEQTCEEELIKGLGHTLYNSVFKAKQLINEATTI